MKIRCFKILILLNLLAYNILACAKTNAQFQLDISNNEFGLNQDFMECVYDSSGGFVECRTDPNFEVYMPPKRFNNVYVRKLNSDPVGKGYIGSYYNPSILHNPNNEATSTADEFYVFAAKYS